MGIRKGDRVAYISPNIHAQLESYYAVPQLGAVLVPINYRLSDEEFAYLLNHSGAKVLCVARTACRRRRHDPDAGAEGRAVRRA